MNIDINLHDNDDDKYPDSMTIEEFYKERGIPYPRKVDLSVIGQLTRTRQAMGMTMKALAETIGVPTQRINDFEKKRRKPPISVLVKWVDTLNYDVAPFVFDYMMEELEEAGLDPNEFVASFQDWGKTPPRKKA
jgi:DNA-binding XRE family transcriptional regulator